MKKVEKNKSITIDDLAVMVAGGFNSMEEKIDGKFASVNKHLEDIDYRLGKIESNHERRLDLLEDKMQVVKTYFERHPNLKVKF